MIIMYGASWDDVSVLDYPSQEECSAAIEPVFATLKDAYPELTIICRETDTPSTVEVTE